MPKKLSIITINFNNYAGLQRTAESVMSQTSRSDFEWLVIDGAGTDESKSWLASNKDKIDVLISEKDDGIYDAMNKGMNAATGEYIWFMNSGDAIFDKETSAGLLKDLESNKQLYYSDTMFIDMQGKELGLISKLKPQRFPKHLSPTSFRFGMNICHQSFVVQKEIAPKYDLAYRLASDIDWVISILKKCPSQQCCDYILSRFETGGSSYQNTNKAWKERYDVLAKQYGVVQNVFAHAFIIVRRALFKLGFRL